MSKQIEKLKPEVTEWKDGKPWSSRALSREALKINEIIDFITQPKEEPQIDQYTVDKILEKFKNSSFLCTEGAQDMYNQAVKLVESFKK